MDETGIFHERETVNIGDVITMPITQLIGIDWDYARISSTSGSITTHDYSASGFGQFYKVYGDCTLTVTSHNDD